MKLTENGTKKLSLIITSVLHLLFLFIALPTETIHIIQKEKEYETIPVTFIEKKPKPIPKPQKEVKKTAVKKVPEVKKDTTPKKSTPVPQQAETKEPPRKPSPGDRDTPIVAAEAEPVKPKSAINNGWSGTVELLITINKDGLPIQIELLKSSGHEELDQSFIRTVKNTYRFKPKVVYGEAQIGTLKLKYTFENNNEL